MRSDSGQHVPPRRPGSNRSISPGDIALDHTDHMIGAEAIARFISTEMHRPLSEIDIAFRAVHADGDSVIVEERMRATLPGGRTYDNDYCFVVEVEVGRIKQVREYMDTRKGWQMVFGEAAA